MSTGDISHSLMLAVLAVSGMRSHNNESSLRRKIHAGSWLGEVEEDIEDCTIKPYSIGDDAFPLEPQLTKCYDRQDFVHQKYLNRSLMSTRQKIENAFGFYQGRWHVVVENDIFVIPHS